MEPRVSTRGNVAHLIGPAYGQLTSMEPRVSTRGNARASARDIQALSQTSMEPRVSTRGNAATYLGIDAETTTLQWSHGFPPVETHS